MAKRKTATPVLLDTNTDTPLSFESPESGTILSAWYDPHTRQMTVVLRKSAVTYRYPAISASLWEEFVQAKSKGQFFAARIRPLYVGVRV